MARRRGHGKLSGGAKAAIAVATGAAVLGGAYLLMKKSGGPSIGITFS